MNQKKTSTANLKGTLPLALQKANPVNEYCSGGVYHDFKSCHCSLSHFNSQKNYNLLGLMQHTVIRLAIKSHFWDCVIWVTNICKYLYILCNSWPQILMHQSKKVFLMLPTLFWTYNFMMTAASQNSTWIKFITQFVMWDFLNSKPIEQQQIKVSVYSWWIKINHMLKNSFLTLKRYLVSRTFEIGRIHQLFYTSGSIWGNTSSNISLSCQTLDFKKRKKIWQPSYCFQHQQSHMRKTISLQDAHPRN